MKIFSQFLQDEDGSLSATRLAFLTWVIGVLVVWIIASCSHSPVQMLKIDGSIATILGILMSGKVVQKFAETGPTQAPTAVAPITPGVFIPPQSVAVVPVAVQPVLAPGVVPTVGKTG